MRALLFSLMAGMFFFAGGFRVSAQGLLDRSVSLRVHRQPLARVLDTIAARVGFAFSYNTTILPGDSLVSYTGTGSVRQVLNALLGTRYQFLQRDGYVIIIRAPPPVAIYTVTGTVIDRSTGAPVANASVYEPRQLQSVLTDEHGFFRLRLREESRVVAVSKEWYEDTVFTPEAGQESRVFLRPVPVTEIAPVVITSTVEHSWWGRMLLSSRERVQSLNLVHFFTTKPYQVSLLPSIGTQGRMGAQVTNTISINLIGGYSAGTHGVEIAGAFNLDRRAVRHVQAAGLLNVAGGLVTGVQMAGLANIDMDSTRGAVLAGGINVVYVSADGVQMAGGANVTYGNIRGMQAAGGINECKGTVYGVQMAGLYNHAAHLKGFQIGLINIADTSSGYSFGLVSIVRHGVHQLSLSYEEGWTAAYKSGNPALYSIVLAGYATGAGVSQGPTLGYGVGRAFPLAGRWGLTTELTAQQLYDRHWHYEGDVYRFSPSLTFRLSHTVSVFAGPRVSHYVPAGDRPWNVAPFGAGAGLVFF
jgi:hypothetical protein